MLKIIEWILQTCGLNLMDVLKSESFSKIIETERRIATIGPDTDEGIAYRLGHLTMGSLFARYPEKSAIEQAKLHEAVTMPSIEERALIRLCGEKIVSAAEKCLPQKVRDMAKLWSTSSSEVQLQIVRDLFFEFHTESQDADGEMSMQVIIDKIRNEFDRRHAESSAYLPGLYGTWNKKDNPANCQGKTQMLLAFAKLAGAEAVLIHPIEHAKDYITKKHREMKKMIELDLAERSLESGSALFTEGILASNIDDRMRDKNNECFHVGLALRLKDGRWAMLDPHGLSWGLIPAEWGMNIAITKLDKYRDVLPGLTVIAGKSDINNDLVDNIFARACDILDRSKRMGELIKKKVRSVFDLIEVVYESDDFDFLMKLNAEQEGKEPIDLKVPEFRRYAATVVILGDPDSIYDFGSIMDPELLDKKIKSWLTFYHACAMNLFLNRETNEGLLIHPVCEVAASAEWSVAISAINSVRIDRQELCELEKDEAFFVRNSFDQTSLYNAAGLFGGNIAIAAQKVLQSLPYKHPMCIRKLKSIERTLRYER